MKTALVCIAKNEPTIEEWCYYHLKLGFDNIYVYQNNWICDITNPKVHIIDFPIVHEPKRSPPQMRAYNSFLRENRNTYDWVGFIDVDEYIVLKQHHHIKEFIAEFDNPYGIGINEVYFGSDGQLTIDKNNQYSLINRFFLRSKMDSRVKCIINTAAKSSMAMPHKPNSQLLDTNYQYFNSANHPNGSINIAQINHYYHKSLEEWRQICERGQADNTLPKVVEQWHLNKVRNKTHNFNIQDMYAYNFLHN